MGDCSSSDTCNSRSFLGGSVSFKFAKDHWLTEDGIIIKYDKVEHAVFYFVVSLILILLFPAYGWPLFMALLFAGIPPFLLIVGILEIIGLLNEIKDGFLDYKSLPKKWRWLGGDGFSWRDLVSNQWGLLCGTLAALLYPYWSILAVIAFIAGIIIFGVTRKEYARS